MKKRFLILLLLILIVLPFSKQVLAQTAITEVLSPPQNFGWWRQASPGGNRRPSSPSASRPEKSPEVSNNQVQDNNKPKTELPGNSGKNQSSETNSSNVSNNNLPSGNSQSKPQPAQAAGPVSAGHSFTANRSPIQSLFLEVKGGEMPIDPPLVYYRFTARTLERHGGVALGSSVHQAKVNLDKGVWRADIMGHTFGTVEVFSRFKLGEKTVYSQINYLHFLTEEDAKGLIAEPVAVLPSDWPLYEFPFSKYNAMPFRGLQTGETVNFDIAIPNNNKSSIPQKGLVVDTRKDPATPVAFTYDNQKKLFTFTPPDDSTLEVSSGAMGGQGLSKQMVSVVELPNSNDLMTFSLNVTRSRWSYRKLAWGAGLVLIMGLVTTFIVLRRRKRFKYNDRD